MDTAWIETFSGKRFNYLNPKAEDISLEDIAHSLSMQCRYNGHTREFYSVAEHCILMARWVMDFKSVPVEFRPEIAMIALMHDATEAYVGDMPKPLKNLIPDFEELEARIWNVIVKKFDLGVPYFPSAYIKSFDTCILLDERAQGLGQSSNDWGLDYLEPLGVILKFYTPQEAEARFLELFGVLGEMIANQ